jgi:hypothetical protein
MTGATLGKGDGVMQMGADVTTGSSVTSMASFFGGMIVKAEAGSWLWGSLYASIKFLFAGHIKGLAKKASAPAPAPAA